MSDFIFDHSFQINKNILKSRSIFLFLDYDGTLVSFKDRPTDVTTPRKVKNIINKLIKNPKMMVIIVTGRSLIDIKKLMNMNGLSFIALHGLQIETTSGFQFFWEQADQARLLIKRIKEHMILGLEKEKGAFIEDKELTVVLHYRLLPTNRIQNILHKFKEVVNCYDTNKILEIIHGNKVIEARPKGWNKGKAIEMFLTQHAEKQDVLPIYIGDDVTDEDAFEFLGKKGISIYVSNLSKRKTAAQYWVKNPDDVFFFLQSLSQLASQ